MKYQYNIDTDCGVAYEDCGPWRSYQLYSWGNTEAELIENAQISEIDQDGGDLDTYALEDAPAQIEKVCLRIIQRLVSK